LSTSIPSGVTRTHSGNMVDLVAIVTDDPIYSGPTCHGGRETRHNEYEKLVRILSTSFYDSRFLKIRRFRTKSHIWTNDENLPIFFFKFRNDGVMEVELRFSCF